MSRYISGRTFRPSHREDFCQIRFEDLALTQNPLSPHIFTVHSFCKEVEDPLGTVHILDNRVRYAGTLLTAAVHYSPLLEHRCYQRFDYNVQDYSLWWLLLFIHIMLQVLSNINVLTSLSCSQSNMHSSSFGQKQRCVNESHPLSHSPTDWPISNYSKSKLYSLTCSSYIAVYSY